jgi:hypothetical protein
MDDGSFRFCQEPNHLKDVEHFVPDFQGDIHACFTGLVGTAYGIIQQDLIRPYLNQQGR